MSKKKIFIVVGARPNFIKVACFKNAAQELNLDVTIKIIHTGQHYDGRLSTIFFEQLRFTPDFFLNISPASANQQIANIMLELEKLLIHEKPDLLMVVGDVNSTLAAAITANKLNIPLAHVESGLRSFDHTMPEEVNRILTDQLSDFHFVTEQSGLDNLLNERHKKSVHFVGNTMIDTLVRFEAEINNTVILDRFGIESGKYILITMHRPSNVDHFEGLNKMITLMQELSTKFTIVFPVHPRTLKNLTQFNLKQLLDADSNIKLLDPIDYFSFQKLLKECYCVITDSGGVQEETTFSKTPCITLRPNTERPVTITTGTNELLPFETSVISKLIFDGKFKKGNEIPLWDGKSSHRILEILKEPLGINYCLNQHVH